MLKSMVEPKPGTALPIFAPHPPVVGLPVKIFPIAPGEGILDPAKGSIETCGDRPSAFGGFKSVGAAKLLFTFTAIEVTPS